MGGSAHVLVVEDDLVLAFSLKELLEEENLRAAVAHDGIEALDYLDACDELPRAILLDLMMPRLDGWMFLASHRESTRSHIPVIVVTAMSGDRIRRHELEGTACQLVVTKPYDSQRLMAAVRVLVGDVS